MARQQVVPAVRRASLQREPEEAIYDDFTPPRLPTSAIRRQPAVIVRGNKRYIIHDSPPPPQQEAVAEPRQRRRVHPLLVLGTGMLLMFLLWTAGNASIYWWNTTMDDLHYGRPRTFQIDAVVGHNDSLLHPSHFVATNINRHIFIFELPGGDASKAKIYLGPSLFGDNSDLDPVTLTFRDVNGDGKLDMIITVANSHIIYINDNGQFRPVKPGEQVAA